MKKIIITGGDNCYCCHCGGVADRLVMELDTDAKTLRYIDMSGFCLGKYCWRTGVLADGTELFKGYDNKVRAFRNGEEIPVSVRHSKWGKDGEYGSYGSSFWTDLKGGEETLRRLKKGYTFDEYLNDTREWKIKRQEMTEETGYRLVR